jgi:hypothetical protein
MPGHTMCTSFSPEPHEASVFRDTNRSTRQRSFRACRFRYRFVAALRTTSRSPIQQVVRGLVREVGDAPQIMSAGKASPSLFRRAISTSGASAFFRSVAGEGMSLGMILGSVASLYGENQRLEKLSTPTGRCQPPHARCR